MYVNVLNAVDKNEKFVPFVAVKGAAAASFSASITGIFFGFSRLGILVFLPGG